MSNSAALKVGIVGYGYVGHTMADLFIEKNHIEIYDPFQTIGTKEKINECDIAIVCVPTSMKEDGRCDTSIVEEVIGWIKCPLILIKSTIPPGTTASLIEKYHKNIVFSPEFCSEPDYDPGHNFHNNAANEPHFIFGGDPLLTSKIVELFSRITGPCKTYMQCTAGEAEIIKYMDNSFLATKVIFTYEMEQICKAFGEDFFTVREGWLLDPRINKSHTMVFKDNDQPFGGKCLPKDLSAIVMACKDKGYSPKLLEEVIHSNSRLADKRQKENNE